jgi:EAL domain-containing protein (putative c-di-GMP-specific phosphodiesterase class I)
MDVIAEGIESAAVGDLLRDLGCDFAQGYFYATPMPASELVPWFRENGVGAARR